MKGKTRERESATVVLVMTNGIIWEYSSLLLLITHCQICAYWVGVSTDPHCLWTYFVGENVVLSGGMWNYGSNTVPKPSLSFFCRQCWVCNSTQITAIVVETSSKTRFSYLLVSIFIATCFGIFIDHIVYTTVKSEVSLPWEAADTRRWGPDPDLIQSQSQNGRFVKVCFRPCLNCLITSTQAICLLSFVVWSVCLFVSRITQEPLGGFQKRMN